MEPLSSRVRTRARAGLARIAVGIAVLTAVFGLAEPHASAEPSGAAPQVVLESSAGDQSGGTATWNLRLVNRGGAAVESPLTVVDELPEGVRYLSARGNGWACSHEEGVVTCRVGEGLAPAQSTEMLLTAAVDLDSPTSLRNTASVSELAGEAVTSDNVASATAAVQHLRVSPIADPASGPSRYLVALGAVVILGSGALVTARRLRATR